VHDIDATGVDAAGLSEEELTALALGALPISIDGAPVGYDPNLVDHDSLPTWYMPAPRVTMLPRWQRPLVVAVIGAFLLIDALGLCNTYGLLSWA